MESKFKDTPPGLQFHLSEGQEGAGATAAGGALAAVLP